MPKLKREEFERVNRFREPRKEGLVKCTTCACMEGEEGYGKEAYCAHPERVRRVSLTEPSWDRNRRGWNHASDRVCDVYTPKPLPSGAVVPSIPEGQAIQLYTQWGGPFHVDSTCPYVTEELRLASTGGVSKTGRKGEIEFKDISEYVPGDVVGDICDMPCCERKFPFQDSNINGYRTHVGIHPNARDPRVWVRNNLRRHRINVRMTPEEAEAAFDFRRFDSSEIGNVYKRISAVADWLHANTNLLGSRPLSEAVNPIALSGLFETFNQESVGQNSGGEVWVSDPRLFNREGGLEKPIAQLEKVPEGILPCMDCHGVLRTAKSVAGRDPNSRLSGSFYLYGILRPVTEGVLASKGLTHFLEINAVSYHGHEHMWGEFGRGFGEIACWDQE